MAQSFTRQMKKGIVIPVFNKKTGNYDYYKKLKNTGLYSLDGNGYTNSKTLAQLELLIENNKLSPKELKKYNSEMLKEFNKVNKIKVNIFKKIFIFFKNLFN